MYTSADRNVAGYAAFSDSPAATGEGRCKMSGGLCRGPGAAAKDLKGPRRPA